MSQMNKTPKGKDEPAALNTYEELDRAVMHIHRNPSEFPDPCLEVTKDLFGALTRGQKTPYLTYGNPGIKIFELGTQDKIEKEEEMTAEAHRDLQIKRMREEKNVQG